MYDRNILSVADIDEGVYIRDLKLISKKTARMKVDYPLFQRSPRLLPQMPKGEVEILNPPAAQTKPVISWLTLLLPPLMMACLSIVMASLMKSIYMYFSLAMLLITSLVSVLNYLSQRKGQIVRRGPDKQSISIIYITAAWNLTMPKNAEKFTLLCLSRVLECVARVSSKTDEFGRELRTTATFYASGWGPVLFLSMSISRFPN
jgi:S-DNA-T family DNA segregation ATPase FtsK/SpoIIIE